MRNWRARLYAVTVAVAVLGGTLVAARAEASNSLGVHWLRAQGAARAQVYFIDFTGSRWPVSSLVPEWNAQLGVDVYYKWQTCPGAFYGHCVEVKEYNSADGRRGYMSYTYDSNNHFVEGSTKTYVRLNNNYSGYSKHTACQELGHALGLQHQYTTTCMNDNWLDPQSPNSHDLSMLESIYNH